MNVMMMGMQAKPIPLPYRELPGFSKQLLSDHYQLYQGYIDRLHQLEPLVAGALKRQDRWAVERLMTASGFLLNAIRLHELYFENLTPGGKVSRPLESAQPILVKKVELMALGAHGWVILGVNLETGKLVLFTMKEHSQGYVASTWPVLVLDCYEHAYMRDYGIDKMAYLKAFFKNVDWTVVGGRLKTALRLHAAT